MPVELRQKRISIRKYCEYAAYQISAFELNVDETLKESQSQRTWYDTVKSDWFYDAAGSRFPGQKPLEAERLGYNKWCTTRLVLLVMSERGNLVNGHYGCCVPEKTRLSTGGTVPSSWSRDLELLSVCLWDPDYGSSLPSHVNRWTYHTMDCGVR